MKKILCLMFCAGVLNTLNAQMCCPYVATPTIIPGNPTPNDNVKIIVSATTPNQGTKLSSMVNVSSSPNHIKITNCYWEGMATATKTFIDTLTIGQLAAGNWSVSFVAISSSVTTSCVPKDSNNVGLVFNVGFATALSERSLENRSAIFPNPVSDRLYFKGQHDCTSAMIVTVNGAVVKAFDPGRESVDVSDLAPGIYFVRFFGRDTVVNDRFVKIQ